MATPSSNLAQNIPQTEEPGGVLATSHEESETTERLNNNQVQVDPSIGDPIPKATGPWATSPFEYLLLQCFSIQGFCSQKF